MALFSLTRPEIFPPGTAVPAYKRSDFPSSWLFAAASAPPAGVVAVETQNVAASGVLSYTALADDTAYIALAQVGGTWTRLDFRTAKAGGATGGLASETSLAGVLAAAGATTDAEAAAGNGTLIAIQKRLRTLLNGGLPAALGGSGGLKVDPAGAWPVDSELPAAAALTDADGNPTVPGIGGYGMIWDSSAAAWRRLGTARNIAADNTNGAALLPLGDFRWNGAGWDKLRAATIFKTFAPTAITAGTGATIWTPAGGKKFRVLGLVISSSAAGQLLLGDNVVGTIIARSATLAAGGIWQLGVEDLTNGILSAAANNVLKIDGPTGNVAGMVWGTEE